MECMHSNHGALMTAQRLRRLKHRIHKVKAPVCDSATSGVRVMLPVDQRQVSIDARGHRDAQALARAFQGSCDMKIMGRCALRCGLRYGQKAAPLNACPLLLQIILHAALCVRELSGTCC